MKALTLTDKDQKIITKLINKQMARLHAKFTRKEKDLDDQQKNQHHKKMAKLTALVEKVK